MTCNCYRPDRDCKKCYEEAVKRGTYEIKQEINERMKKILDDIDNDIVLKYAIINDKDLMKKLRKVMKKDATT